MMAQQRQAVFAAGGIVTAGLLACVLLLASTPRGTPTTLLGVMPQPYRYPKVFVTRSGTMLAEDDGSDHSEDQDGQSLNDIAGDQEDRVKAASPWPFYEYSRPVRAAHFDDFGRIKSSGKCGINNWNGGADYEGSTGLEDVGTTYNFPQNPKCQDHPSGVEGRDRSFKAKHWGYKCYSSGNCALFETGDAEEGEETASRAISSRRTSRGARPKREGGFLGDGGVVALALAGGLVCV
ncbi:hypothetical protein T484DRAFT_2925852 [Baffinella frigidus]|nr:hypothetical protein T484DRAFT_2925852 [Cryptophyta sp. CCMP2293]